MRRHVVAVATALVAVALLSACASALTPAPGSGSTSDADRLVGYRWILTAVVTDSPRTDIPESLAATIQFTADGRFLASDTVNAISGSYTLTDSGFSVHDAVTTLMSYAGTDPKRLVAIAAMDAISGGGAGQAPVAVTDDRMPLSVLMAVPTMRLTLRRLGSAVTFGAPSPTPT